MPFPRYSYMKQGNRIKIIKDREDVEEPCKGDTSS